MAKAVRITVTSALVETLLGIGPSKGISLSNAQVTYHTWHESTLELLLSGEGLPDVFTVNEGDVIPRGRVVAHRNEIQEQHGDTCVIRYEVTCEITPL